MKIIIFTVSVFAVLNGCAISPGMSMADITRDPRVKVVPITADLIYNQKVSAKNAESELSAIKRSQELLNYQYKIGPRDVLSITVWDHPELTIPAGEFRSADSAGHLVAEDGTIFYPYVGSVRVGGKTVSEIRQMLTEKIARTIAQPQLDVRVAAFRSQKAYIVGEVTTPGIQPITDEPLTVVMAINKSGGVTVEADMLNVTLSRGGTVYKVDLQALYERGDLNQDFVLRDGDIVQIPDRNLQKVFVLGEVLNPSSYLIHKGRMTLAEALGDAGGVNQLSSDPARIFVIRAGEKESHIFHLNSSSPEALILGDQFQLAPRDIVYVDTAGLTRWNKAILQILPTSLLLESISTIEFQSR